MPWVRLDENCMEHPKFLALNANAWRLWCEGMTYCQKHLTDGFIPDAALRQFRYYSPKCRRDLTATLIPGKGPLWHETESGVHVHDYLEWNDGREHVLQARQHARVRLQRLRDKKRNGVGNGNGNGVSNGEQSIGVTGSTLSGVACSDPVSANGGSSGGGRSALVADELSERAGRFCERYAELFAEHRQGARYFAKPALDYEEACRLCATWPDSRLETLAIAFLTTDDKFCREGSGTIKHFASRASWCDGKLKAAGL